MRHHWTVGHGVVLAAVVAAIAACVPVTVNITFPQEKLDSAAGQIEDMVRSPAPPKPAGEPGKEPSSALERVVAWLSPREAAAQGRSVDVAPRIETRSPELMKAIESRRARRGEIRAWKERGCIGETNEGMVAPRPGEGCGGEVAGLITAENADRQVIYETFMRQNKIPAADTPRVRSAFAKARLERARPNDWIQLEDGRWVRKQP